MTHGIGQSPVFCDAECDCDIAELAKQFHAALRTRQPWANWIMQFDPQLNVLLVATGKGSVSAVYGLQPVAGACWRALLHAVAVQLTDRGLS